MSMAKIFIMLKELEDPFWEMKILNNSRGGIQGDKRGKVQDNSLWTLEIIFELGEADYPMISLNHDHNLFILKTLIGPSHFYKPTVKQTEFSVCWFAF